MSKNERLTLEEFVERVRLYKLNSPPVSEAGISKIKQPKHEVFLEMKLRLSKCCESVENIDRLQYSYDQLDALLTLYDLAAEAEVRGPKIIQSLLDARNHGLAGFDLGVAVLPDCRDLTCNWEELCCTVDLAEKALASGQSETAVRLVLMQERTEKIRHLRCACAGPEVAVLARAKKQFVTTRNGPEEAFGTKEEREQRADRAAEVVKEIWSKHARQSYTQVRESAAPRLKAEFEKESGKTVKMSAKTVERLLKPRLNSGQS